MIRKKFYFDDVFADILLMHTLNHAAFKGAETGECLAAAARADHIYQVTPAHPGGSEAGISKHPREQPKERGTAHESSCYV